MKYIFLAIAFSGFLFGCVAQKTITPKATKMYTPIVDKKFEKFLRHCWCYTKTQTAIVGIEAKAKKGRRTNNHVRTVGEASAQG